MSGPMDTAYAALAVAIADALIAAEVLPTGAKLVLDPPAPFLPTGDETELTVSAALVKRRTGVRRTFLGGGSARYQVERECQLEMSFAGPDEQARTAADQAARAALAPLAEQQPTLGGVCERLLTGPQSDDEVPPNGTALYVTFYLRVRSADQLGMTS